MTNVPRGAGDRYHVYRPLLDLIGFTEGTDKGRGYNETLAYGKMLDGKVTKGKRPTVELVSMTLKELDALQTRMLSDPDNKKLNSSAAGRYQIVRTTARAIRKALPDRYPLTRKFDAACQDEMACYNRQPDLPDRGGRADYGHHVGSDQGSAIAGLCAVGGHQGHSGDFAAVGSWTATVAAVVRVVCIKRPTVPLGMVGLFLRFRRRGW